ncbi:MAG: Fpg/Nei family DNA glycosylase [Nitriliruptorales bacterium]|nr:Fpg/Nei family DNA glycosylase [Nitriliruptorales bacterium]
MPELPEVHAHAERLTTALAGAALDAFEPLSFTALKTYTPAPDAAVGRRMERVWRRGKHLLLEFPGEPPLTFVVHLMQGGRLRPDTSKSRKPKNGLARWRFDSGAALLLTEAGTEHRAGVWVVAGDPLVQPPLDHLGPEADAIDDCRMAELLAAHSMRLHTFLRDQRILAGIGRRLANEVCHRAKLSPFAATKKLDDVEAAAVVAAIRDTVDEGLSVEREHDEMTASADRPGAVHGRTGEPCRVCGDAIREIAYRDYTVNYCATCQTGGKVLADNTTSKFLK